jgi:hypothetical protein
MCQISLQLEFEGTYIAASGELGARLDKWIRLSTPPFRDEGEVTRLLLTCAALRSKYHHKETAP